MIRKPPIDSAAKQIADDFFARFAAQLSTAPPVAEPEILAPAAVPPPLIKTEAAPQPVVAARQEPGGDNLDPAKADAAASSPTSVATAAARDQAPGAAAASAPGNSADTGAQATGTLQPQLASATIAAPAAALVVSLATNAPVPLNGLV